MYVKTLRIRVMFRMAAMNRAVPAWTEWWLDVPVYALQRWNMTLILVYTLSKTILGHSFFNYILVQISIPRSWELALECLQLKAESPDNHTVTLIVKKKQCPTRGSSNQVCIMYGLRLTKGLCSLSVLDHIKITEVFTDSATIGIEGPTTCLFMLCKT